MNNKIRSWRKMFQLQRGDYFHYWVVLGFDNYGEWTILHTFSYKSQAKRWIVEQKKLLHEEFKDWCNGRVIFSVDGTKLNFNEITMFFLWQMNRFIDEDVKGECDCCGATIYTNDIFEYIDGQLCCQFCADEITREE